MQDRKQDDQGQPGRSIHDSLDRWHALEDEKNVLDADAADEDAGKSIRCSADR